MRSDRFALAGNSLLPFARGCATRSSVYCERLQASLKLNAKAGVAYQEEEPDG